jgi:hypothetical protein
MMTSPNPASAPARAAQNHEPVDIYGRVIALPRFWWWQRVSWWLIFKIARFDWGLSLIRRLRG